MASTATGSAERATAEDWYVRRSPLNRCNLSPGAIASQAFQDDPRDLELAWIRQEHHDLFRMLAALDDPAARGACFHAYAVDSHWRLEPRTDWPAEAERLRASYVMVLRGWGIDSNGASGAVFKGWAEHRFGLRPIWHRTNLSDADAQEAYAAERMRGAMTGIGVQLDLLYAYCQEELRRRHGATRWLTLYRGTHDPEAYVVKRSDGRDEMVEFNNISSFTADRETAWEFGSRVWAVRVPLAKIVYFTGLLPNGLLQGEAEHIVLGGDYVVRPLGH